MTADVSSAYQQAVVAATRREQWEVVRAAVGGAALLCVVFGLHSTLDAFSAYRLDSGVVLILGLALLLAPVASISLGRFSRRQRMVAAGCLTPVYALLLHSGFGIDRLVMCVGGPASAAADFLYTAGFCVSVVVLALGGVRAAVSVVRFSSDRRDAKRPPLARTTFAPLAAAARLAPIGWLVYLVMLLGTLGPLKSADHGFPFPIATGTGTTLRVSVLGLIGNAALCYGVAAVTMTAWRRWVQNAATRFST